MSQRKRHFIIRRAGEIRTLCGAEAHPVAGMDITCKACMRRMVTTLPKLRRFWPKRQEALAMGSLGKAMSFDPEFLAEAMDTLREGD